MTSNEIRQVYLDFFKSKGHTIVPSAPLVIKNDPTLMFTNAGMNQFKDIFLGNTVPKFNRAADSQKCLRVSGKHNDLEAVGHDGRHHTMFEMLGNWSFGDYFKTEAIDWAWELLTEVYKIDKTKLYATVFEGDKEDGTSLDIQAKEAWLKHLPADHILLGNKHDNFWEMGETGPCGPCSEIHIDLRSDEEIKKVPGNTLVNTDNDEVIEIWNLVFMQYNRKANGELESLPNHNIDTGMGFERLCMVLQGKKSNYDTDIFSGSIKKIEELSGRSYHESGKTEVAMRVIADHLRAIAFSIADGQLPSNVKAGYVIRRILRRAVRYGYTFLGFNEPFLCRLVERLAEDMGGAYPELISQKTLIENVIKEEELAFLHTLDRGIKLLEDYMDKAKSSKIISGEDAFILYDTFGFPLDLTELIASEHGYSVEMKGFEAEMLKQKERARNASANEFGDWIEYKSGEESVFLGYDCMEVKDASLIKHRTVKQKNKVMYQLVFDKTPFYAEMGGQIGDTGIIVSESGEKINILNTIKENELTIHIADRIPSNPSERFTLQIDSERRIKIVGNHTATHLLGLALRQVLGSHVEQKGSFVGPDYFRFDFSHFSKMTDEEISKAERLVNKMIRSNFPLEEFRNTNMDDALAMGAVALFGEKYGEKVRVIKFGKSIELCGGTHAAATGQLGFFKIVSEGAVAAGIRRIEAVTGEAAENLVASVQEVLRNARAYFNNTPDLSSAIKKLMDENGAFKKEIEGYIKEKAISLAKSLADKAENINGIRVVRFSGTGNPAMIKNIAGIIQKEEKGLVFAGAFEYEGKPQLILMYTDDLVASGKNAVNDVREAAKLISGGGGGQAGMATAGGKDVSGLDTALGNMIEKALK